MIGRNKFESACCEVVRHYSRLYKKREMSGYMISGTTIENWQLEIRIDGTDE